MAFKNCSRIDHKRFLEISNNGIKVGCKMYFKIKKCQFKTYIAAKIRQYKKSGILLLL